MAVDLVPQGSFSRLLTELRGHSEHAAPALTALWETMNTGGFSPVLRTDLKRFNGGLLKDASAMPLSDVQLGLLIDAPAATGAKSNPPFSARFWNARWTSGSATSRARITRLAPM